MLARSRNPPTAVGGLFILSLQEEGAPGFSEIPPTQSLCEKPIVAGPPPTPCRWRRDCQANPRENRQPSTDPVSVEATTVQLNPRENASSPRPCVVDARLSVVASWRRSRSFQSLPPPTQGRWRAGGSREGLAWQSRLPRHGVGGGPAQSVFHTVSALVGFGSAESPLELQSYSATL